MDVHRTSFAYCRRCLVVWKSPQGGCDLIADWVRHPDRHGGISKYLDDAVPGRPLIMKLPYGMWIFGIILTLAADAGAVQLYRLAASANRTPL